jgi:hypothetical protein
MGQTLRFIPNHLYHGRIPDRSVETDLGSQPAITGQIMNRSIDDQIRGAYELHVQRGGRDGNSLGDWLDAEFEPLANR